MWPKLCEIIFQYFDVAKKLGNKYNYYQNTYYNYDTIFTKLAFRFPDGGR